MRVQDTNERVKHNGTSVISPSMGFMFALSSSVFLVRIFSVFKIIIIFPFPKAPILCVIFITPPEWWWMTNIGLVGGQF